MIRLLRPLLVLALTAGLAAGEAPQVPQTPSASASVPQKVRKRGGKKKWILIAAVSGAAVVAVLLAVNPRLANEGHGIF